MKKYQVKGIILENKILELVSPNKVFKALENVNTLFFKSESIWC